MNVSVVFARPTQQIWKSITVEEGATVADVVARSGLLDQFPEIDLEINKVGIFGSVAKLDKPVTEGDRIEIYRPIHPDAELLEKRQ